MLCAKTKEAVVGEMERHSKNYIAETCSLENLEMKFRSGI